MSLAIIRRFAITSCRGKIEVDACRKIVSLSSLRLLSHGRTTVHATFAARNAQRTVHGRLFRSTAYLCKHDLKDEDRATVTADGDISTLQIKKRPPRRNRAVVNDDKAPKSSVSSPERGSILNGKKTCIYYEKENFPLLHQAWNVKALATAEEYNLEALAYGLLNQQLYIPSKISTSTNCKYL